MKKILPVLMCVLVLMGTVSLGVFATNDEKNEEKQASYIALLAITKRVLEACIDMLGFEAPERM